MRLRTPVARLFFVFCTLLLPSVAMAQAPITLSNFSYTPQNLVVGKVMPVSKGAGTPQVKLSKESARLFELSKDKTLKVKKAAASTPQSQWLEVVLEAAGKQYSFRIVKDEFIKNKVIAHRGAWKNTGAPENSIGALQHAIRLGCTGSEFDVHMSVDSVLFVNHDHDIKGLHIEKTPAAELAKVKLPNGESLPTLEAYLNAGLNQNKTRLILEIKPSAISKERGQALAQKVVEMVQRQQAQGWVDYISFDYAILKKVLELEPSAHVSYLNGEKTPTQLAQDQMYGFDYHQSVVQKNPDWIAEAHRLHLTVNVWTVNDPNIMDWLLERNADFITTNEPELLLQKVNSPKAK